MFCKYTESDGKNVEESVYAVSKVTEGDNNSNNDSDDNARKSVSTKKDYRYKLQEFEHVLRKNINDCEKQDLNGNVIKVNTDQLNGGSEHKTIKKLKQLDKIHLHDSVDVKGENVKILNNGFKRKEVKVKESDLLTVINKEQEELLGIESQDNGLPEETEDESLESIISDFLSYFCKMRDGQLMMKRNKTGQSNTPTVKNDQAVKVPAKESLHTGFSHTDHNIGQNSVVYNLKDEIKDGDKEENKHPHIKDHTPEQSKSVIESDNHESELSKTESLSVEIAHTRRFHNTGNARKIISNDRKYDRLLNNNFNSLVANTADETNYNDCDKMNKASKAEYDNAKVVTNTVSNEENNHYEGINSICSNELQDTNYKAAQLVNLSSSDYANHVFNGDFKTNDNKPGSLADSDTMCMTDEQCHLQRLHDSQTQLLQDWMGELIECTYSNEDDELFQQNTESLHTGFSHTDHSTGQTSDNLHTGINNKEYNTGQTADSGVDIDSHEDLNSKPPPLPPRKPTGDSQVKHQRHRHTSNPSDRRAINEISNNTNQMVCTRSPSVRKRDAMQRRYNSTSALFVPFETPTHFLENNSKPRANSINSRLINMSNSSGGQFSGDKSLNQMAAVNISDDHRVDGNCSYVDREAILMSRSGSWTALQDAYDYGMVDIVGESFEARYPWQRDVSTQCSMSGSVTSRSSFSSSRTSCESIDSVGTTTSSQSYSHTQPHSNNVHNMSGASAAHCDGGSNVNSVRKRQEAFRKVRPNSMGSLDSVYKSEYMKMDEQQQNGRRGRMSEPLLQNSLTRRRMPLLVTDDPGSVSDLESILENPREGSTDTSRSNSLESAALAEELSSWLKSPHRDENRSIGVLHSPRVSPDMWSRVPDVIVDTDIELGLNGTESFLNSSNGSMQFLTVPRKPVRRRSSGSIGSGSEESDHEPSPPAARRGRRAAIVDTKNFGDVSPTTLSPEVSPSNSCDEGDGARRKSMDITNAPSKSNIAGRIRRRRSSVDLAMNVYPGDLLVQEHHKKLIKRNTISDFYATRNGSTPSLSDDSKKNRASFSLLKLMRTRSKESLSHLGDLLQTLKPSEFKDNLLAAYKTIHWTDLIASTDKQTSAHETLNITEMERKRRETVWELFKSECVFLIDHLMVLKHCFLEPLKKVQVEGFLMYAEPSEIFSNLDELCYVSYTFCKDFIASLVKDMSATDFGSTAVLIKAFERFSNHSKDGSVYHTYCLNYTNALIYLEKLRKNDDFCEFEKWCEQDQRCNRLQLADLLIGPMQHCTKLPLLLHNIKKYTEDLLEKKHISDSIEKVETSLKQLEEKMKWLKNFERVQEIQRHLVWPSVTDIDSRVFIPEYLKSKLLRQPCERLLACPRRQLVYEGAITLTETAKSYDAYLFLFDDILLITRIKKPNRKKQASGDTNHATSTQPDRQTYTVYRQPLALDRIGIHDVNTQEAAANGLKFALVIVQISRFQQIIDVFTLQASSELMKSTWMTQVRDAKSAFCNKSLTRENSKGQSDIENNNNSRKSSDGRPTTRRPSCGKKIQHGKSLSLDAIFL